MSENTPVGEGVPGRSRQWDAVVRSSAMLRAWNFTDRTIAFSTLNGMVSAACWKLHSRPVVAVTGLFNSFLCLVGLTYQFDYPALANGYVAIAATSACLHHGLHAAKTPSLRVLGPSSLLFGCWLVGAAGFAVDRMRWVYALWGDA